MIITMVTSKPPITPPATPPAELPPLLSPVLVAARAQMCVMICFQPLKLQ